MHVVLEFIKKRIVVDLKPRFSPMDWVGRAVLGEAKSIQSICKLRGMLVGAGFHEVAIAYIGGLTLLLVFDKVNRVGEFIAKKEIWDEHLLVAS